MKKNSRESWLCRNCGCQGWMFGLWRWQNFHCECYSFHNSKCRPAVRSSETSFWELERRKWTPGYHWSWRSWSCTAWRHLPTPLEPPLLSFSHRQGEWERGRGQILGICFRGRRGYHDHATSGRTVWTGISVLGGLSAVSDKFTKWRQDPERRNGWVRGVNQRD